MAVKYILCPFSIFFNIHFGMFVPSKIWQASAADDSPFGLLKLEPQKFLLNFGRKKVLEQKTEKPPFNYDFFRRGKFSQLFLSLYTK
jgi:hypothetical protein